MFRPDTFQQQFPQLLKIIKGLIQNHLNYEKVFHLFIYSFNCLIFLALVLLVSSCEKSNDYNEEPDPLTKDELAIIFTTYSDPQISELGFDFDALIYENFSFEEIEKLLLERLEKFSAKEAALIAEKLFDEYNSLYQSSYLDESSNHQEEFAASFLDSNPFRKASVCSIWPDLLCPFINEGCIERQEDTFTIRRQPCVREQIIANDCARQKGTDDCDYNYSWTGSIPEYIQPERFQFYWYTDNVGYRFLGNGNISGFANDDFFNVMTCFLGERHRIAFNIAWFLSDCAHEEWIAVTRFGSIAKGDGIECGNSSEIQPL